MGIVRPVRPSTLLGRLLNGAVTNVDFNDAERLLEAVGFEKVRVAASHHIYAHPGIQEQINMQNRRGQAKPYQLRQLAALVRRYNLRIEEPK
jgi:hypothetical protein